MARTQTRGKRSKKSVCEKSMNIMVNFIRVSSLSLAKLSLGSYGGAPSNSTITHSVSTAELALPGHEGVKKLLVEPNYKEITKGSSYLMEPHHEVDDDINWRAGQFIDGFRKRNMVEYSKKIRSGVQTDDFVLLPPPPRRPNR